MTTRFEKDERGVWLTCTVPNVPNIYVYAEGTSDREAPITVFWGGQTDGVSMMNFFLSSSREALKWRTDREPFRTMIFTDDEEKIFNGVGTVAYPESYAKAAKFVRFEHLTTAPRRDESMDPGDVDEDDDADEDDEVSEAAAEPDYAADADYIVWANLEPGLGAW